ncbi:MAG: MFS transporter [Actinobacteria bacterium]|nr:MFS transporter [Actinomycetota bacterium]
MNRILARLEKDTGGVAIFALVVLCLLYFFDEFDTAAFNTLAPNIEKAFHLTDQKFVALVVANVSLLILLAIPVGYLGDRVKRTGLVVLSGVLAGVFSLGTGLVGSVALLTLMRFGNGLGLLANIPIHNSLLTDYYPPETRGAVFADHINAMYLGAIIGPALAGLMGNLFGWRSAFLILFIPILITTFVALRLKEPIRGATDDPTAALEAQAEDPVAFKEAARTLWAVRSLKRQFIGAMFLGAGLLPLAGYLPLYLERVFHLDPLARGLVGAADAAATFYGVQKSGQWTAGWFGKGMHEPFRRAGISLGCVGIGISLMAGSPWLVLTIALGLLASFAIGVFGPPFYATQALISPARVRTLSFSYGGWFLVAGVVALFYLPGFSAISDHQGIRWGIFVLGPYWVIAGAILNSAGKYVADDAARALRTLTTTVELRKQRLSAGEKSLLVCAGVDVAYDSVQVLFGVDLDVKDGEIVALLGTNGAGKSTLLKAISGLVDPIGGAIFFDGHDVTHVDARKSVEVGIVQMPGGRSIFPTLTVNECLRLAAWMYKRQDPEHVKQATAQVLEYFPVLAERGDQLAGNLSGGEQQMLGLGMAFIAKPRLLMIDELSLGLAPSIVGRLVDIVRAIHERGTTVILVEQSVNVALTLAQRAVFMEKGEVRFTGPTADLLERDDILRSVFLEGAGSNGGRAKVKVPTVRAAPPADAPVLLELVEVTKRFGGIQAVDAVSFELRQGQILGLIGPNGAGKTTLFDLVSGFLVPDAGHITLQGKEITNWSPERRSWAGLGRSFQDARLFPSLTVAECIAVALERHLEFRDPLASALGLPSVAEAEVEVAWQVHELIELLGLGAFRNKFISELSTGSRRIVDLAMTIAHQPSVLILDEPSSGIAQRETEALGPLLLRIQQEAGCSLLVIEHDMPLVTSISDSMIALELGRVIASGTPQEVVNHPEVVASYLGAEASVIARSGTRSSAPSNGHAPAKRAAKKAAKQTAKRATKSRARR